CLFRDSVNCSNIRALYRSR
ncbi:CBS domain protein, partial [Vibrio parahaemolyticus V-223/04]